VTWFYKAPIIVRIENGKTKIHYGSVIDSLTLPLQEVNSTTQTHDLQVKQQFQSLRQGPPLEKANFIADVKLIDSLHVLQVWFMGEFTHISVEFDNVS
jgi:hypothetical protein